MSEVRAWKVTMKADEMVWTKIVHCEERDLDEALNEEAIRYCQETGSPVVLEAWAEPATTKVVQLSWWGRFKLWWYDFWTEEA
jgi:hypothetical protein